MRKMLQAAVLVSVAVTVQSKVPDRARLVQHRHPKGDNYHDIGRPLEGQAYRSAKGGNEEDEFQKKTAQKLNSNQRRAIQKPAPWNVAASDSERELSSKLAGCCYNYQEYSASKLCYLYGHDCESGKTPSHESGDGEASLPFIGISFSVKTASGNPYSNQLCDQFPMENIIDRDYEYIMSMDEDGWLVGGGYNHFDYSGKMSYIDSSYTELFRIGNLDPDSGETWIDLVYKAMGEIAFAPFSVFPEFLTVGGSHQSGVDGDVDSVPSGDVTLIVSIVETYEDDDSFSLYQTFLEEVFTAIDNVGGGPLVEDHDTDHHVPVSHGVKFWSAYHSTQYAYAANLEVAVWQAMYPKGVPIGSKGYAIFPPGRFGTKQKVGYGNLYFFSDRANITKSFPPYRGLTDDEMTYAMLYSDSDTTSYYASVTSVDFDYSGDDGGVEWTWNPYLWNQMSARHHTTDGWQLPPNCKQEGETFLGIPLSRTSASKLQSVSVFQDQFDFEYLVDRNGTYVTSFGTNHGWLIGEDLGNAVGSTANKDTAHIPIFYTGTTNADLGGIALGDLIKVIKKLDFGTLYIKPAFVFVDDNGHLKLQFEADTTSALAYLYDNLCKELGISWNYASPTNSVGKYTECSMHSAADRATNGCGPDGSGTGGFCPQMTLAYAPKFASEDAAAAYLARCNNYVDYWRALYPSGVAVGTDKFCKNGGCLALFLNRLDIYQVFQPDLKGAWVDHYDGSMPPTYSPAPTWKGGCDDPRNYFLDKCLRQKYQHEHQFPAVAWDALGTVGQIPVMLLAFLSVTLSISICLTRALETWRRNNGSYVSLNSSQS